jgi:hypothetical protein
MSNLYKNMMEQVNPAPDLISSTKAQMCRQKILNEQASPKTLVARHFMPMMAALLLLVGGAAGFGLWLSSGNIGGNDPGVSDYIPFAGNSEPAKTTPPPAFAESTPLWQSDVPNVTEPVLLPPDFDPYEPGALTPLTADEADVIKYAYAAHLWNYLSTRDSDVFNAILADVSIISYYGTYDGHHVVVMSASQENNDDYNVEIVAGYPIVRGSSSWELLVNVDVKPNADGHMPAYSVRPFVTLEEGFTQGLLSRYDLFEIWHHSGRIGTDGTD